MARKSRSKTKRWARRAHARPGELIDAAMALFAERGYAATRLEDVAARAGVSKATIYLYYENKERLFEAVVREAVVPNVAPLEALVASYEGTTADLIRALIGYVDALLDGPFPAVLKMVLAESGNFPQLAKVWAELVVARVFALVARAIGRGVARGELRDVNPAETVPSVMAPVLLLALWKHSFQAHTPFQLDRRTILAAHAEVVLRGLAKEAPR